MYIIEGMSNKPGIRRSKRSRKRPKLSYNGNFDEKMYDLNSLLLSASAVKINIATSYHDIEDRI